MTGQPIAPTGSRPPVEAAARFSSDKHVLHLWTDDGRSFDVRWPKELLLP